MGRSSRGAKLTAAGRRPSLPANTRTSTHRRSAGDTSASGRVHARERGTRTSASATIGTSDLISLPATGVSIRTNRMVNGNTEQDVPDAHSPQVVPEGSGYIAGIVVAQLRELIVAAMSLSHEAESSSILPFWIPAFAGMTEGGNDGSVGMTGY